LHGELVEVGDLAAESGESFKYADTLLPQKINVPLKTDDKTIGAISLNGLPPDDQSRRMVLALADLAATAIAKTRLYERTQVLAITDDLTSLYNRRGFNELGQREFERARRFGRPLVTLMFDIDHFKDVNDAYGHAAGNQTLAMLAEVCRNELREVDLLGRYGGEEFVALLPETDLDGGRQAAERLRRAVAKSGHGHDHGPTTITISLGVAVLADSDETLAALIDRADRAMYLAKRTGRNRVCVWTTELMATQS
jgi:diguanylate cyclase (GGDEF)-like protein